MATLVFMAAETRGASMLSHGPVRNIAEAAGLGSASELLRLLGEGADPAAVMPIRADVISASVRQASALEAAVWSRRVELVALLDSRVWIQPDQRHGLVCLARDLGADDVAERLSGGKAHDCVPNQVLQSIQARPPLPEFDR
jgi:hypothetical protein